MWAGALLTAIGILALLARGGVHYFAHEHLPHYGSAQVTVKKERVLSVPALVGGVTLAAGIGLMLLAARR